MWNINGHELHCIVRGRLWFGSAYNAKFYYDCKFGRNQPKKPPNCHGTKTITNYRDYVNFAPNRNVR